MNKPLGLLWLCLTLVACSGTGTGRWWEDGSAGDYGADRYLTGVGVGDTCVQAEDAARGRVAAFFRSTVVIVEMDEDSYRLKVSDGEGKSSRSLDHDSFTRTKNEAVLENVFIADRKQLSDGTCAALAVLDKEKEKAGLNARIRKLDGALRALVAELDAAAEPRQQAHLLRRILAQSAELEPLQERSRLLGGGTLKSVDRAAYRQKWNELVGREFSLRVDSGNGALDSLVLESLAARALVNGGDKAKWILYAVRPFARSEAGADAAGNPCIILECGLAIRAVSGGADVAVADARERVCHPQRNSMEAIAFRELQKKLVNVLLDRFVDFLSMETVAPEAPQAGAPGAASTEEEELK